MQNKEEVPRAERAAFRHPNKNTPKQGSIFIMRKIIDFLIAFQQEYRYGFLLG